MLFQMTDEFNIYLYGNRESEVPQDCGTGGEILFGCNSIITEKMQCWANGLVLMHCCH